MLNGVSYLNISSNNKLYIPNHYHSFFGNSCVVIAEDASLNCSYISIIKDNLDSIRSYYIIETLDENFDRSLEMFVRFSFKNGYIKLPDFFVNKLGHEVILVGVGDKLELYSKRKWENSMSECWDSLE